MIDNIIPFELKKPVSRGVINTAERLSVMSKRAEVDPDKFRYMILMTASKDLDQIDWVMAGHPSIVTLLGLVETVKSELHQLIKDVRDESQTKTQT